MRSFGLVPSPGVWVAVLLAVALAAACAPAVVVGLQPREEVAPSAAVGLIAAESLTSAASAVSLAADLQDDDPVLWVATHKDADLWSDASTDSPRIARLPTGSYFIVIGDAENDLLPVHYWGSTAVPARDGWVESSALGPIPTASADWMEPTFPPRRVVNDLRTEVERGDPSLPLVALTFDAGANRGATLDLLDVLRTKNVRATFFVTGQFADRNPDIVQIIAVEGHELANHSYTHPDFANLTEAQMRSEIRRATEAIEAMSGVKMAPFWRAPYGSRNARILQIVEDERLRPIYWTFDSGDWLDNATTERVLSTDLRLVMPGAIVVHHVQPRATAEAMPTIIDTYRSQGYELVTVSDLIGP